jgi:hypothetical protein
VAYLSTPPLQFCTLHRHVICFKIIDTRQSATSVVLAAPCWWPRGPRVPLVRPRSLAAVPRGLDAAAFSRHVCIFELSKFIFDQNINIDIRYSILNVNVK